MNYAGILDSIKIIDEHEHNMELWHASSIWRLRVTVFPIHISAPATSSCLVLVF